MGTPVLIALVLTFTAYTCADPCTSYQRIPDIHRRDIAYALSSGEESINDRELVEGWYGDINFKLPGEAPGFFKCGGWYPMWRSSTNSTGQTSAICVQDDSDECSETFDIEMKTCNGFEVYYLQKAPIHRAVYCFINNPDAPPSFYATPWISVDLDHQQFVSKLLFRCNFPRSAEDLFYKTIWFVEGAPVYTFEPAQWTNGTEDYIINTTLTEDILAANNVTKAGINIQCAVRAQYHVDGAFSESTLTDNKFVGVKIHHWNIFAMTEGETRELFVQITVPFGCGSFFQSVGQPCHFNLEVVTVENHDDCESAVVVENSCGIKPFEAERWGEYSSLTFVAKVTSLYGDNSATSHLRLKTPEKTPEFSTFWEDYDIGHVSIQILKNTTPIHYKSCSFGNDPYLNTFDNIRFSVNGTNVYTFYKDESRNIEVQVETEICSPGDLWWVTNPFCACGVAVRAGRTVFEISHCESLTWNIGFSACGDGGDVLNVKRNWNWYEITFPTGTILDVYMWTWDIQILNLWLYPTVLDEGKSRGMCGVMSSTSDDDLTMRNGQIAGSTEEFADSWKINRDESLFNPDVIGSGLSSYKPAYQYCTCNETSSDKTITCSPVAASAICKTPDGFETIKPRDCIISKRKKRMAKKQTNRYKRATTDDTWTNGWNETAATAFCESKFAESSSVYMVKDVPGVDITSPMKDCIADIKASGTDAFSDAAVAGVAVTATREAMVNPVLSEPDPVNPSAPTLFDVITLQTCPSDCSGRGVCSDGRCQCNSGYGGGDCSVDLTTPPELVDVGDGSHCDLATKDCLQTSVLGNVFSGGEDSKCLFKKHTIHSSGTKSEAELTSSFSRFESISEVYCSLPSPAKNDVVVIFNISVSNSGKAFSNEMSVLVYDSTCVNVDHVTGIWTMQDGYCVYKGRCFAVGSMRSDDPCVFCQSDNAGPEWKFSIEDGCPDGNLHINESKASRFTVSTFMASVLLLAQTLLM